MTRLQLTDDQAFDALRAASQRLNRKLSAIAEDVNYTGDVPGGGA
jgi:AmiR/NasT family two-component response regulator